MLVIMALLGVATVQAQSSGWVIPDIIVKLDDGTTHHEVRDSRYNLTELITGVQEGDIVVAYGDYVHVTPRIYNHSLTLYGDTDHSTNIVANGVWIRNMIEHSINVKDYTTTPDTFSEVDHWVEDIYFNYNDPPDDLITRTEVEFHEPYGVILTKTELLKVNDTSTEFDWYDVTVTQTLTPGANSSGSDWEWGWLTYTMNGSMDGSNVFLSDYDLPPSNELPKGLFSFLWRILNFHPRDFLPWLYETEVDVEGLDMSDFSLETFTVRYQAPDGFTRSNEPLETRHHYVIRVEEGVKPRFWQQTQVKYVRAGVIAAPPYYSPLLHEGYLELG